jgi:hypothetical protein
MVTGELAGRSAGRTRTARLPAGDAAAWSTAAITSFPPADVEPTTFAFVSPYPQRGCQAMLDRRARRPSCSRIRAGTAATSSRLRCSPTCCCGRRLTKKVVPRRILTRNGHVTEGSSSTDVHRAATGTAAHATERSQHPARHHPRRRDRPRGGLAAEVEVRGFGMDGAREPASEVWIASAGRGVLPVTSVDGRPVGNGKSRPRLADRCTRGCNSTWIRSPR